MLDGGAGNDTLDGGDGSDLVSYVSDAQFGGTAGVNVNLATGIAIDGFGNTDTLISIEGVSGSNAADTLVGSDGIDILFGLGGNDFLDGGAGEDAVVYLLA